MFRATPTAFQTHVHVYRQHQIRGHFTNVTFLFHVLQFLFVVLGYFPPLSEVHLIMLLSTKSRQLRPQYL
jgi:hypothetical protein